MTGILPQLPLPPHLHRSAPANHIAPQKDMDGLHPANMCAAVIGSCTALAVMRLLDSTGIAIQGRDAVIVRHSDLVGKPLSLMLINRLATVTICHIATAQRRLLAEHDVPDAHLRLAATCIDLLRLLARLGQND